MDCDHPPQKRNWRLYHLLDLLSPITARQVKWNFRKVTLRHHYYEAYLVLYNRSRKYLFDAIGEDGYGFIASGTWGPWVPVLGTVGSILVYCVVLMVEMALLLIFFAFLAARDADMIAWDWVKVVAPLMAFAIIMVVIAILAVVLNFVSPRTYRENMSKLDRLSPVGNMLAAICYFCIPFVIGSRIKDDPHAGVGKFLTYMCLPIMGDIFYYATSLIWRWPRRLRLQMEVGNNRPDPVIYRGIFAMAFLHMTCGIAQWVLIGYKLDEKLNRSWYIIFIPFCFRTGFRISEACLRSLMKYTIGVRSKIGVAFDTVGSFFVNGILLISLYFVAVRIERGKGKVKLAHALIPVYIVLGYIFIFLIVTMIILLIFYRSRSKEERRINSAWVPPQDNEEEQLPKTLGHSTTSDSAPVRVVKTEHRAWEDVDDLTNTSAAFPEDLDANENEQEYDDFDTEDEEPVFQSREASSPRSSQLPYGSPRDDERTESNSYEDTFSDAVAPRPASAPYEVRRRTTTTTRRVIEVPADEVTASESASGASGSRASRSSASHSSAAHREDKRSHHVSGSRTDTGDYSDVTSYLGSEEEDRTSASRTEEDAIGTANSSSYTGGSSYYSESAYTGDNENAKSHRGSYSSSLSSSHSSYTSSAASERANPNK